MKLDFSGVEEFVPVGVGRYRAEVTASGQGLSDRSSQAKWSLALTVIEAADGSEEFVGKVIKWDVSLQKSALWKVMQNLQALGEDVDNQEGEFEFDPDGYVGREVTMVVTERNDPTYGKRTQVNRLDHVDLFKAQEAEAA